MSYGSYQLSSTRGMVQAFLRSPDARLWSPEFAKLTPGTPQFNAKWRAVASREPEAFHAAQHAFVGGESYTRAVAMVKSATGMDLDAAPNALRQATFSASVKHGGAAKILNDAIGRADRRMTRTDPRYNASLINAIYDRRTEYVIALRDAFRRKGDWDKVRNFDNILNKRYPRERAEALRLLSEL